ncbi:ATPase [Microbacterium sp. BWT-B31]|uniref:ATPase n=1 Tax=Microbacterium sp. BWT-B31 TaxID=3232072 RepID=UPI003528B26D
MKNLLWFVFGIAGGFVLAHLVNKDPRGREALAELDSRITEFTDRMSNAYREQEARFSGLADAVAEGAAGVVGQAKAAASDVVDAAEKLAD